VVIRSGCKESKQAAGTLPSEPGHVPAAGAEHKTGRQRFERVKDTTGNGKGNGALKSLEDLPAHVWKLGPKDDSGIQFYTDVLIGVSEHSVMIDGGSGVNSTTEELVLEILEENRKAGIGLADKRHPIKNLEKWEHEEALRGVAGGKSVPLLGSVVMAVKMVELGKDTGPEVLISFKICKSGSTDWVGWIIGARCIDCPERGGLGFVPLEHSHSFTALGIQMKRSENPGGSKPDQCFAVRASVFDSDDESEVGFEQVGGIVQGNADDSESEHLGTALLYEGDPISLAKGSAAWVPVVAAQKHTSLDTETLVVLKSTDSPVEVVPGIWGSGDEQGVVCVVAEN